MTKSLNKKYRQVFFVGHSMGCLLGIDTFMRSRGCYSAMILLACPLYVNLTWKCIFNSLEIVFGRKSNNKFIQTARNANSVYVEYPIQYLLCFKQYFELYKEMKCARRKELNFDIKIWAIHSEHDEIVSYKSLQKLSLFKNVKPIIAECSSHYFYSNEAKTKIVDQLLTMLELEGD